MKRIIIFMLLVLCMQNLSAQRRGGNPQNMPKNGIISGQVTDRGANEGIPAASVYLYSVRDSSLASGAIADASGNFKIEELAFGKYYMKISLIGYHNKIIDDIKITPQSQNVYLDKIAIDMSDINLGDVEVTADRTRIDYRVDKKIVTVSNDIVSSGGSAVTVLENVPSVEVDVEGNVSLRGSSSFTVFINGKPTVLDPSDALEQIPASNIENIEIITNPSAKYDPEGIGGIINVITKKQKQSGFSGNAETSVTSLGGYKGSALFNYNFKGFNIFAGANYNVNKREGEGISRQETFFDDNTSSYMEYDISPEMQHSGKDVKLGMSYEISDMTSFSLEATLGTMEFERNHTSEMLSISRLDSTEYSISSSDIFRGFDYYSLYFDFIQKFNDKGHNLTASVYYSSREGDGDDLQERFLTDMNYISNEEIISSTKSLTEDKNQETRIKLDYTLPISKTRKFEAGFHQIMEPKDDSYILEMYSPDSEDWTINDNYSNSNTFDRNISAIYSTFTDELFGFNYMLGLRGEYTNRIIEIVDNNESYEIDRFDIFPSLHISNQINEQNQIYLSYSRRLQRPGSRMLDPNPIFRDEFNYMQGNPELEPEYINSYEFGYQRYFKKSYISSELFYRNTTNIINRIIEVDENGLYKRTSENLDQDHSIGLELMSDISISPMFTLNASANLFYYKLEGSVLSNAVDEETFVYSGRLNGMFRFSRSTSLQANVFYRSKNVTAQGTMSDMWGVNLGARQAFFDNNLVVSFNVRDLFDTFRREIEIDQANFYNYQSMNPISPVFTLSLSYKFNNFKQKRKLDDGGGESIEIDF